MRPVQRLLDFRQQGRRRERLLEEVDLLLQDALLDEVETALATVVTGSADLLPILGVGAPLRHRNRIYNCAVIIHLGRILGVVPKSYPPNSREFN